MRVVSGSCVYFFRSNSFFILFFFAGDGTKHGLGISLIIVCSSLVFYPTSLVAVVLLSKIVDDSLITVWMMMYSCLFLFV